MDDYRFVPKRPRINKAYRGEYEDEDEDEEEEERHPSGLSKELRDALDSYRPLMVGGRVKGTDDILMNWGGRSKYNPNDDPKTNDEGKVSHEEYAMDNKPIKRDKKDGTPWHEQQDDHPASAQNVIRRNIDNFLRLQMNKYVLDNHAELDLSTRDVEQVQKNIINYWLNKHLRIERDPMYQFAQLVAGMLDERVEFLLADARSDRDELSMDFKKRRDTDNALDQKYEFENERNALLRRDAVVRDTLESYLKDKIEGKNATLDADTFMKMLQDFEISGHVRVSHVLTNAWKAVHAVIVKEVYPRVKGSRHNLSMKQEETKFYNNIKDPRVREAYARGTAAQMMFYRQLDKKRQYLASDYGHVETNLKQAYRDIIYWLRNGGDNDVAMLDPDWEDFAKVVAGVADTSVEEVTEFSGMPTGEVMGVLRSVMAQILSKRGIVKTLTHEELVTQPQLRANLAVLVGLAMQSRARTKSFKTRRSDQQRASAERDMNAVWTDMLMALKNAGLLKIPPPSTPYSSF